MVILLSSLITRAKIVQRSTITQNKEKRFHYKKKCANNFCTPDVTQQSHITNFYFVRPSFIIVLFCKKKMRFKIYKRHLKKEVSSSKTVF